MLELFRKAVEGDPATLFLIGLAVMTVAYSSIMGINSGNDGGDASDFGWGGDGDSD